MFDLSKIIYSLNWLLIIHLPQKYQCCCFIVNVRGKTTVFEQHFLGVMFCFRDTHEVGSVGVCVRWKVPLVLHMLLWTMQTTQWLLGSQVNVFYTNRWVTNRTLWQFIIWWHRQFTKGHFTDDYSSYTVTVYQWYWYTVVINWYFYFYPSLWQTRSKLSNLHTICYIYFYKLSVQKLSLCKLILHTENQWQLTVYALNITINMQWQLNLCNGSL